MRWPGVAVAANVRSQCAGKPSELAKIHATEMDHNREFRIGHLGELSGVLRRPAALRRHRPCFSHKAAQPTAVRLRSVPARWRLFSRISFEPWNVSAQESMENPRCSPLVSPFLRYLWLLRRRPLRVIIMSTNPRTYQRLQPG